MNTYLLCIKNENYEASLEVKKIYKVISSQENILDGFVRIIDESGEDYLYPSDYFIPIEISKPYEQKVMELV
jgi:hypothetical protein